MQGEGEWAVGAGLDIDARRNRTGNGDRKLQEGRTGHVFR